jgi:hypothetical protein
MLFDDPIFLLIVVFLAAVIFALFLLVRRTLVGFKEGMNQGKR